MLCGSFVIDRLSNCLPLNEQFLLISVAQTIESLGVRLGVNLGADEATA
jgi:hypothetical protein